MWTVDDVMATNPCYDRERVKELFAGREYLDLGDALALDIPISDKIWIICQLHPGVQAHAIEEYRKYLRELPKSHKDAEWIRARLESLDRPLDFVASDRTLWHLECAYRAKRYDAILGHLYNVRHPYATITQICNYVLGVCDGLRKHAG